MSDPLIEAVSLLSGNLEAVHEPQRRVVGFPRAPDIVFPCIGTGRGKSKFAGLDADAKPLRHSAKTSVVTFHVDKIRCHNSRILHP